MGFSVSASTIIIFIGVLVAASLVYNAWTFTQDEIAQAREDAEAKDLAKEHTNINITDTSYDTGTNVYTVNVSNTGDIGVKVNKTTILTDGVIQENATKKVVGSPSSHLWLPGDKLKIEVSTFSKPNRTKVVTDNGICDMMIE
ncbi:MAG: fla cluster protein FlaF [Halobacteria archaeon]|nr:fla cluster protein FlaF [Halobacteria archaeon]